MSTETCCETCVLPGTTNGDPSPGLETPEAELNIHRWPVLAADDSDHIQFSQRIRQCTCNVSNCNVGANHTDHLCRPDEEKRDDFCLKEFQPSEMSKSAECLAENAKNITMIVGSPASAGHASDGNSFEVNSVTYRLKEEEPNTAADNTCECRNVAGVFGKASACEMECGLLNSEKTEGESIYNLIDASTDAQHDACSNCDLLSSTAICKNRLTNYQRRCETDDSEGSGHDYCTDCCDVVFKDGIEYRAYGAEHHLSEVMDLIGRDLSEPYSIYTYRYFIYNWPHLCIRVSVLSSPDFFELNVVFVCDELHLFFKAYGILTCTFYALQ
jgi:hypothetical protein